MKSKDLLEIGKRIQDLRKRKQLTQEDLARLMDVSVQMISNLERGNKAIKIDNLINLSSVLGASTDYILTGKSAQSDIDQTAELIGKLSERDKQLVESIIDFCLKK